MASPGETDATVTDLVLDFLASKGFADAEAALREQLDAAEAPPVASEGISPLEMMLIRGRTAASESQVMGSQSVMQPLALPNGALAYEPTDELPNGLGDKLTRMELDSATEASSGTKPVWYDPTNEGDEDDWTDDEALGYLQIEVSEETLKRGFESAASRAEAIVDETDLAFLASEREGRDPIFEMFENRAADAPPADRGEMADDEMEDDEQEEEPEDETGWPALAAEGEGEAPVGVLTARNGEAKPPESDGRAKVGGEASAAVEEPAQVTVRLDALDDEHITTMHDQTLPTMPAAAAASAASAKVATTPPNAKDAAKTAPVANATAAEDTLAADAAAAPEEDAAAAARHQSRLDEVDAAKQRLRMLHEQVMALTSEAEQLAAKKKPEEAQALLQAAKADADVAAKPKEATPKEATPTEAKSEATGAVGAAGADASADAPPKQQPASEEDQRAAPTAVESAEDGVAGVEEEEGEEEEEPEPSFDDDEATEALVAATRRALDAGGGAELAGEEGEEEEEEGEEEEGEEEEEILESDPEIDPYVRASTDAQKLASMSLKVIHTRGRTGFEEHKDFPIRLHSLIAARYQVKEYLGSAAFSKAVQCLDLHTGEMVCVKIIKNNKDFFDQSLDEVMLLDYLKQNDPDDSHHVVHILDYFYHKEHLFIVCELLRDNLYEFARYNRETGGEPYFTLPRLRRIARQCCEALAFVHKLKLIHCDLKPENILIKSYSRCEVKVIDFGSSCYLTDHLSSYVQSRSYRAPEVILGLPYDGRIDMWSLGAILAELLTGYVLFQNDSVAAMLARISSIVGPFPEDLLQRGRHAHKYFVDGVVYERDRAGLPFLLRPKQTSLRARCHTDDDLFLSFVGSLLSVDPALRPTAEQALNHPWLATDPYGWPPPPDAPDANASQPAGEMLGA